MHKRSTGCPKNIICQICQIQPLDKLIIATDLLLQHERFHQNERPLPEIVDQLPEAGACVTRLGPKDPLFHNKMVRTHVQATLC